MFYGGLGLVLSVAVLVALLAHSSPGSSSPTATPGDVVRRDRPEPAQLPVAPAVPPSGVVATTPAGPPSLRVTGVSAPSVIAPPEGSPLRTIRRDCPLSAPLSDGRTLWIFCDTSDFSPAGKLRTFVNTTAAFSEPGEPGPVHEPYDRDRHPFRFLTPTGDYRPCAAGQTRLIWPHATVTVPQADGRDRVLIYYQSVCSAGGVGLTTELFRDVGLAEYLYDPKQPPAADTPIRGTVLREQLFARPADAVETFGSGAAYDGSLVYVYRCERVGRCYVGRVDPAAVADPAAYGYWNGVDWQGTIGQAAPMALAGGGTGFAMKPSVRYLADRKLWVLADAAQFGAGTINLRLAHRPEGPWGPAAAVVPSDCTGTYPRQCLGVEVHPQFGDAGTLALSYYNPAVPLGESPVRFVRVSIEVDDRTRAHQ